MLRSPLLSNTHATRGAWDALVRPYGNGALNTCSMVKLSPKQQTGIRTEMIATQGSGVLFTAARLYSFFTTDCTDFHGRIKMIRTQDCDESASTCGCKPVEHSCEFVSIPGYSWKFFLSSWFSDSF